MWIFLYLTLVFIPFFSILLLCILEYNRKNMSQIRKTPIYGNCQVHSPTGELMFRCLEKRAKWYLDRNLATTIGNDPLSIKLNFVPKGKGEAIDVLKMERKNKCVVCGTENIDVLTKHHLVPFVYRQHFPNNRKQHSSLFVVPICRDCHFKYENEFANQLKSVLAEAYSAPINGDFDNDRDKTIKIIRCLKQFNDRIPQDRRDFLKEKLKQNLNDLGINGNLDFSLEENLDLVKEQLEQESKEQANQSHGKTVVDRILNFDEFEKMWAKHFVDSMKPEHMPEYLLKTLCSFVSELG